MPGFDTFKKAQIHSMDSAGVRSTDALPCSDTFKKAKIPLDGILQMPIKEQKWSLFSRLP
jgi:hypothetical protein